MLMRTIYFSPDAPGGSASAAPPTPVSGSTGSAPTAGTTAPAAGGGSASPPNGMEGASDGKPPASGAAPAAGTLPEADSFNWDKWDGTPDVAPESFRPALSRAQKIASERYAAEQTRQKAEWDAQKTSWQRERDQERLGWRAKESDYQTSLKGTGMVKVAELESARQEMENWKKIAAGMADPRLSEYQAKVKDYETRMEVLSSEKRTLEDAAETQRARSLMDANPHLKTKATFNSFMELLEVGWEDEVAARLAPMSKEDRGEALGYATKYKLSPEQQPLALEWLEAKRKGAGGGKQGPSEGAEVVGFTSDNASGRSGRSGPIDMRSAREAAAGRALRRG